MSPILAATGFKMLAVQYLALICALPAVIAVEFIVARRMLKLGPARAAAALVPANVASTVIVFPLLGLLLFVVNSAVGGAAHGHAGLLGRIYAVMMQAPWLVPHGRDLNWMVPIASLYLLIPAFFASVFVERWICSGIWRETSRHRLRRFSWYAHFASYAALFVSITLYYVIRVEFG